MQLLSIWEWHLIQSLLQPNIGTKSSDISWVIIWILWYVKREEFLILGNWKRMKTPNLDIKNAQQSSRLSFWQNVTSLMRSLSFIFLGSDDSTVVKMEIADSFSRIDNIARGLQPWISSYFIFPIFPFSWQMHGFEGLLVPLSDTLLVSQSTWSCWMDPPRKVWRRKRN